MINKFLKEIKENKLFCKGDRVCVAVSGGADSVALVLLLNEVKHKLGIELVVAHVNHHIRGKESDEDAEFVKNLADKLGLLAYICDVDAVKFSKENKYTLEQGARILRYEFFKDLMHKHSLNKIALAHHIGDQAETVLMHLFRGCGANGLIGMKHKSGEIVRPLLNFTKAELEAYLMDKKVSWREDLTNSDTKYARNFLRHIILPKLEEVYPGVMCNITRLSQRIKRDEEFLDSLVLDEYFEKIGGGIILKNEVNNLHDTLKERAVKKALDKINASVDVFEVHIESLLKLIDMKVGKRLNLPNGITAYKDYNGIRFEKNGEDKFEPRKFSAEDKFACPVGMVDVKTVLSAKISSEYLLADTNKIPSSAVWRKIESGDIFTKFGGGTKKLVDYLTNKKIGSAERRKMVVLANENEVLIIPGIEISDKVKVCDKSSEVVKICLIK